MSFSFNFRGMVPPKFFLLLLLLLDLACFVLSTFLFYAGLSLNPERPRLPSWEDIVVLFNAQAPEPTEATPFSITSQLHASEFSSTSRRHLEKFQGGEAMCIVCLGSLEEGDQVRELRNCCHAFHKDCIDRWVDFGHRTCPMCRSQLLPLWG